MSSLHKRFGSMMVSGMHRMWTMHVAREQRMMASVCTPRFRAGCISGGLADSQPMVSDTSHHKMLHWCVSAHMCSERARGALHGHGARGKRVRYASARVRGAEQRSQVAHERGRGTASRCQERHRSIRTGKKLLDFCLSCQIGPICFTKRISHEKTFASQEKRALPQWPRSSAAPLPGG